MSSYLSAQVGYDRGSVARPEWGRLHVDPVVRTLGGDDLVPALEGGDLENIPRKLACLVMTDINGHKGDRRGTLKGYFRTSFAWQDTCVPGVSAYAPREKDCILSLGDPDWTNLSHRILFQQFARDWLGGSADMNDLHVHTMFYSVLQCLLFKAQDSPAVTAMTVVPLLRTFARGHLVFPDWCKITIQMTHDDLLNDQTQKALAHQIAAWLATVKPELFVARPLQPWDRLQQMKMLCTTLRRGMKHSNSNVATNKGLFGIYSLVPALQPILATCQEPLSAALVDRLQSKLRADRATLDDGFGDKPNPIHALVTLTTYLGSPLSEEQAKQILSFCGRNSDQSVFPDFEALAILPRRVRTRAEGLFRPGPFGASSGTTLVTKLTPIGEDEILANCAKSDQWTGILIDGERGITRLTPTIGGIAKQATGERGEWGAANWRITYGSRSDANVMSPAVWGISSAGVVCDPRIVGPAKWIKPASGAAIPGMEPLELRLNRPTLEVVQNGRTWLTMVLADDEYPLVGFKGCDIRFAAEPPAVVTPMKATTAVSWEAAVTASASASAMEESKVDPLVGSLVGHMKATSPAAVLEAVLRAQVAEGKGDSPLERELHAALREIGIKGLSQAMSEAQRLYK
uniref:Uncharacterized protein n=1 Tax=viral metagenome TaxID=1070528 RepID=A0A6C0K337_9ZZZZ